MELSSQPTPQNMDIVWKFTRFKVSSLVSFILYQAERFCLSPDASFCHNKKSCQSDSPTGPRVPVFSLHFTDHIRNGLIRTYDFTLKMKEDGGRVCCKVVSGLKNRSRKAFAFLIC